MAINIRPMTIRDLSLGLRLKSEANWNQTEADWHRFLSMAPEGGFVAEVDGEGVGTLGTFVLGKVAWIAMVLVDERYRGQGIGTALMRHALAYLDEMGVPTVRLDATPMGQPIYEKVGFIAEYSLTRYEGLPTGIGSVSVEAYTPADFAEVIALDGAITGADRHTMLAPLLNDCPISARIVRDGGGLLGYVTTRPGARATFIGPCIAAMPEVGERLLHDAFARHAGQPVFVDIPLLNPPALALATATGLTPQRQLLRMYRGRKPVDQVSGIWASSGPEKG